MSLPDLAQIDAAIDALADMATRADVGAVLGVPGALEQSDRVVRLLSKIDPAAPRETGAIGAVLGAAARSGARLGARALGALSSSLRSMSVGRLIAAGGVVSVLALGSQYVSGVTEAELLAVTREDERIAAALADMTPAQRVEALARLREAQGSSVPWGLILAAMVAAIAWRLTR